MSPNLRFIRDQSLQEPIEHSRGYLASPECTNAHIYFEGGRHDWRVEIRTAYSDDFDIKIQDSLRKGRILPLTRVEDGAGLLILPVTVSLP